MESRGSTQAWQMASDALAQGDTKRALSMMLNAAQQGEWLAYSEVGHLYEMGGEDIERDLQKALFWYSKSVFEADDPNAHFGLARLYFNGEAVERDYEKAQFHLKKALQATGDIRVNHRYRVLGYVMLATIYGDGLGTAKNPDKVKSILEQAVNEGYVWPLFLLASTELKEGRLLKWFTLRLRAAKLVAALSQNNPDDPRLTGCRGHNNGVLQ